MLHPHYAATVIGMGKIPNLFFKPVLFDPKLPAGWFSYLSLWLVCQFSTLSAPVITGCQCPFVFNCKTTV